MTLSLLICTIPARATMLRALKAYLTQQSNGYDIEILTDDKPGTIGAKRQRLLELSTGDYVTFIDDDDDINPQYIKLIFDNLGADVIGFEGEITTNGRNKKRFTISKEHPYEEKNGVYYRYNNHLSPIRRSIAIQIGYKDISFGEDFDYAMRLKESGLIKTEKYIYSPMYFYKFSTYKKSY